MSRKDKCALLGISRSSTYYSPKEKTDKKEIMNYIEQIYAKSPSYGYRRIHATLRRMGYKTNHKRIQSLMSEMGLQAVIKKRNTSIKNKRHRVHPYLLKDLDITRPNQVWQIDITYINLQRGTVYLTSLIDVFSRKVVGWALSPFIETELCLEALRRALKSCKKPDIINSDQGCQFTSNQWVNFLHENNIQISMDGKGRWADNIYIERLWKSIKYEEVFMNCYETIDEARMNIGRYIKFYNEDRPHQSLNYYTPNEVYSLGKIRSKKELFAGIDSDNAQLKNEREIMPL